MVLSALTWLGRICMLKTIAALCLMFVTHVALAETATIAVASNFKATLERLGEDFQHRNDHRLTIVSAASGVLYNQSLHGARYDVFLSADSKRPTLLEQDKRAVPGSRFTYAEGQLALAGQFEGAGADIESLLKKLRGKLAIANPDLAPYGLAARQMLEHLDIWDALEKQLVMGANIAQAYQFMATGNAELGLVALPLLLQDPNSPAYLPVPPSWHQPIHQQAVLMKAGRENPAALAFLAYLRSDPARAMIAKHGFLLPETH